MGSPPVAATILNSLCQSGWGPTLVVTQTQKAKGRGREISGTAVSAMARSLGLPLLQVQNVNDPEVLFQLKAAQPQLILVVAFGQIFKKTLLSLPPLGCLNLHASLLPKYRGAAPVQWAIWHGEITTGVTLQKMVSELDAGDIYAAEVLPIIPTETSGQLLERMAPLGASLCLRSLKKIASGDCAFMPQDPAQVSFAPKIDRSHAQIDWSRPAQAIYNQIRALQPWPVAECQVGGERLKVYRAKVAQQEKKLSPGEIDTDQKTFLNIGCGEGSCLALLEVQPESRKRLTIAEYLRGFQKGAHPKSKT